VSDSPVLRGGGVLLVRRIRFFLYTTLPVFGLLSVLSQSHCPVVVSGPGFRIERMIAQGRPRWTQPRFWKVAGFSYALR
jgi:hypothetical protein